jgi:hypothetical protein
MMRPFGDVGDVHLAEEREQMVLAQRVHLDVLDEHHVVVALLEERVAHHRLGLHS